MPGSDAIHMLNVAATAPQARRAFFDPMKKLFKTNKHMAEFFYGEDPAEGANQIRLKNDIYIISGNSLAESQEGLNLIAGVADEISAFKVAEEFRDKGGSRQHRGAEGIVNFLRSSASSRFSKNYKVVQISFPRFQNDAIEKALAQGKASIKKYGNEKSTWYTSGPYATWEVKTTVTKADFQEHYDADPEAAATMYECKPPKTMNAFIRDETAINEAFSEVIPNPVEVEYFWGLPSLMESEAAMPGKNLKEGWQVKFRFSDELQPIPGALYCLHGDLAIKGDRAGVAMSHVKEYQTFSGEGEDERPIITNDFVFSFEADIRDADHPREVQIRWYRQLIWELIDRGFEIVLVTFDQFQCLSGDTRIPLLDGTTQTMKELDGRENFWVYSIDSNGSVVPGLVKKAQWTGYRSDMVEVELDNGEVIKATQDHRFMMRDGSYREAGSLLEGDSLMPLYRRERQLSKTSRFYEQLWHPEPLEGRNRWQFTHSMVSNHFYGKLPKGWVTHHIDLTRHEGISRDALKQRRHRARKADAPNNHKVVSITPCEPEMVYDLEVEEYHNFATAAGVFVHNSTDMTQTLNMYGIESGLLSLDRNDKVYQTFKDVILDRRLNSYRPDTLDGEDSLVMNEIKKLRRVGRKIDHLPGQSKDEADALAGSVFNAIQVGGEEDTDSWLDNGQPTELDMLMSSPSRPASQADSLFGRGAPLAGDNPFASGGHGGFGNPFAPENRY